MIPFSPMLLGRAQTPPESPGWTYEVKYDGWRALVEVRASGVRIWTRNGYDISERFPELGDLHDALPPCVLDCELVVLDEDGRPRFEWMHKRKRPAASLVAFDILRNGRSHTLNLPIEERRAYLQAVVPVDMPGVLRSQAFGDGAALLAACETQQLEGIVAKRSGSVYEPGRRSDAWLKIRTEFGQSMIRERMKKAASPRG